MYVCRVKVFWSERKREKIKNKQNTDLFSRRRFTSQYRGCNIIITTTHSNYEGCLSQSIFQREVEFRMTE